MINTKEMARLYKDEYYSMSELSELYNLDKRKVKAILVRLGVRLRRSQKTVKKACVKRTESIREKRVYPHIDGTQTKEKGYYKTNQRQEGILISINSGHDNLKSLSGTNHGYKSIQSLGCSLRNLRTNGLIEYDAESGSYARNIRLTNYGMNRVYEPLLRDRIIKLYETTDLDYQEIAKVVKCDKTYPSLVIREYLS